MDFTKKLIEDYDAFSTEGQLKDILQIIVNVYGYDTIQFEIEQFGYDLADFDIKRKEEM